MSQSDVQEPKDSAKTAATPNQAQQSQKDVQGMESSGNTHRMSIALIIGAAMASISTSGGD